MENKSSQALTTPYFRKDHEARIKAPREYLNYRIAINT